MDVSSLVTSEHDETACSFQFSHLKQTNMDFEAFGVSTCHIEAQPFFVV